MKIIQLVETANSAAELKTAFDRTEWTKIILHFANKRNIGIGTSDNAIRSSLETAFKKIGPEMDNSTLPEDWNAKAVAYGANLPSTSGITWVTIYNHLAPHKGAEIPERFSAFDMNRQPNSAMTGNFADTDKTQETAQEVARWATAPAENLTRDEAIQYFIDWTAALATKRNQAWMDLLRRPINGADNSRLRRLQTIIRTHTAETNTYPIPKLNIDRDLYGWLTSSDYAYVR